MAIDRDSLNSWLLTKSDQISYPNLQFTSLADLSGVVIRKVSISYDIRNENDRVVTLFALDECQYISDNSQCQCDRKCTM